MGVNDSGKWVGFRGCEVEGEGDLLEGSGEMD